MDKQKGISTTLSILLVVLLVTVVGGGLVYKYYLAPGEGPSDGKPGDSQDETADWETYKNEDFGFEIKHPEDVGVQQTDSPGVGFGSYRMFFFRTFYTSETNKQMMSISVVPKDMEGFIQESLVIDTEEEIIVNKKEGVRIIGSDQKNLLIDQIWINHDNKIYIIKKGDQEDIFNQMLSTFHFLEGTVVDKLPIPNAPTLSYHNAGPKHFVQINWNYGIADYFNVYRAKNKEGPWKKIIELFPQSAHTAVDSDMPEGVNIFYYKVASVDDKGSESRYSEISSVEIK